MYKLTIFKNAFDNKTNKKSSFETWNDFVLFLEKLSKIPGYKPVKGEFNTTGIKPSPLISPAEYKENTTRANANVLNWSSWCAIDIDDYDDDEFNFSDEEEFKEQIIEKYGFYNFVVYSTASSRIDHPKFRLVFQLTEELDRSLIPDFWFAVNSGIGSVGDKQTKDLSRMFYVPGIYPNAFNFFIKHDAGYIMDPKDLIKKYPNTEKNENSLFGEMMEKYRTEALVISMNKCINTNFTWTSYRDCPFVSKKTIQEYGTISGTGWYKKMYDMMVAISYRAKDKGYPITSQEIEQLCKEIDRDNGSWYQDRPIQMEAKRAINYVFSR